MRGFKSRPSHMWYPIRKTDPADFVNAIEELWIEDEKQIFPNPNNPSEIANLYPEYSTKEIAELCDLEERYRTSQRWDPESMQKRINELTTNFNRHPV